MYYRTPKGKIVHGNILNPDLFGGRLMVYGKTWTKRYGKWSWTIHAHLHDLGERPVEVNDPTDRANEMEA